MAAAKWLCEKGRLANLMNCVTICRQQPQWKECHLGAKLCAVVRDSFLRYSTTCITNLAQQNNSGGDDDDDDGGGSTKKKDEIASTLMNVMSLISNIWVVSIEHGSVSGGNSDSNYGDASLHLLEDPMFIMSTHTMSMVLERLLTLNAFLLPKSFEECEKSATAREVDKKRAWLSMELLVSLLVPFRVWRTLLEVLSRASDAMSTQYHSMSDDGFERKGMIVRSISSLLTHTLAMCPQYRFTLMELLSTMDIEEHWAIPHSLTQHLLSDVPRITQIHASLRELKHEHLLLSKRTQNQDQNQNQDHNVEQVMDASWSIHGSSLSQHSQQSTTLFVVTNMRVCLFKRSRAFTYEELHNDGGSQSGSSSSSNSHRLWTLIEDISVSHMERLVLGLTKQRIHMAHKTYNVGDVVVVQAPSFAGAGVRIGTVVALDDLASYVIDVDVGRPVICPTKGCEYKAADLDAMDMHRLHHHYVHPNKPTTNNSSQVQQQQQTPLWEDEGVAPHIILSQNKEDIAKVTAKQSSVDFLDTALKAKMDVCTVSFPTTQLTLRLLDSVRRAVEAATQDECRVERDVATAMSIRKALWEADDLEKEKVAQQKAKRKAEKQKQKEKEMMMKKGKQENMKEQQDMKEQQEVVLPKGSDSKPLRLTKEDTRSWSAKLPRHLDPEPMTTVVRVYDPNDKEGIFVGLRVLVLTRRRLFFCSENLLKWQLPEYWRTNAHSSRQKRDLTMARESRKLAIAIERERALLPSGIDQSAAEEAWRKSMQENKKRVLRYNHKCELDVHQEREMFNVDSVEVLKVEVSHDMLDVVEYAPSVSVETPVMYLGFEHIEQEDVPLSLYSHGEVQYDTPSAAKHRYMLEFDAFETAIEWERALGPWMSELRRGAK